MDEVIKRAELLYPDLHKAFDSASHRLLLEKLVIWTFGKCDAFSQRLSYCKAIQSTCGIVTRKIAQRVTIGVGSRTPAFCAF